MFLFFYPSLQKQLIINNYYDLKNDLNDNNFKNHKKNNKINYCSRNFCFNLLKKKINENKNLKVKKLNKILNNKFKTIFFYYLYTLKQLNNIKVKSCLYSLHLNEFCLPIKKSSQISRLILLYIFNNFWVSDMETIGKIITKIATNYKNKYFIIKRFPSNRMISSNHTGLSTKLNQSFQSSYKSLNHKKNFFFFLEQSLFNKKMNLKDNSEYLKFNLKKKLKLPICSAVIIQNSLMMQEKQSGLNIMVDYDPEVTFIIKKIFTDKIFSNKKKNIFNEILKNKINVKKNISDLDKNNLTFYLLTLNYFNNENFLNLNQFKIKKFLALNTSFNLIFNMINYEFKKNINNNILPGWSAATMQLLTSKYNVHALIEDMAGPAMYLLIIEDMVGPAMEAHERSLTAMQTESKNLYKLILLKIFKKILKVSKINQKISNKKLLDIKSLFLIKNLIKKSSNQTVSVLIQIINLYSRFFKVFKNKSSFDNSKHFFLNTFWYIYQFFNLKKFQSKKLVNFFFENYILNLKHKNIILSFTKLLTIVKSNDRNIIKWLDIIQPSWYKSFSLLCNFYEFNYIIRSNGRKYYLSINQIFKPKLDIKLCWIKQHVPESEDQTAAWSMPNIQTVFFFSWLHGRQRPCSCPVPKGLYQRLCNWLRKQLQKDIISYKLKKKLKLPTNLFIKKKLNKREKKDKYKNLLFNFNKQLWQLKKKKYTNKPLLWLYRKYWFEIFFKIIYLKKNNKKIPANKEIVFYFLKETRKRFFSKNLLKIKKNVSANDQITNYNIKRPQLLTIETNVCLSLN